MFELGLCRVFAAKPYIVASVMFSRLGSHFVVVSANILDVCSTDSVPLVSGVCSAVIGAGGVLLHLPYIFLNSVSGSMFHASMGTYLR